MADLDQLKQKYAPVIQTIEGFSDLGAKVDSVSLDGEKLYLKVRCPRKWLPIEYGMSLSRWTRHTPTCITKLQPPADPTKATA